MAVGVGKLELEAVRKIALEARLQRIVVREGVGAEGGEGIDLIVECRKRPVATVAAFQLIAVVKGIESLTVRPRVAELGDQVASELVLHTEVPLLIQWCPQVRRQGVQQWAVRIAQRARRKGGSPKVIQGEARRLGGTGVISRCAVRRV